MTGPKVVGRAVVILSLLLPPEGTVCPLLVVGTVLVEELVMSVVESLGVVTELLLL